MRKGGLSNLRLARCREPSGLVCVQRAFRSSFGSGNSVPHMPLCSGPGGFQAQRRDLDRRQLVLSCNILWASLTSACAGCAVFFEWVAIFFGPCLLQPAQNTPSFLNGPSQCSVLRYYSIASLIPPAHMVASLALPCVLDGGAFRGPPGAA